MTARVPRERFIDHTLVEQAASRLQTVHALAGSASRAQGIRLGLSFDFVPGGGCID
jgi:hypothetical protein